MRPYKLAGCAVLFIAAAVSTGRAADQIIAAPVPARVSVLISQLSDPDPVRRSDAVDRLKNLGDAARPALRQALASTTPEIRSEIDQILLHIPWVKPGDSDAIEQALTGYADLDAEARCAKIDNWLAPLPQGAAAPALLRVILSDPSPAVRWEAASVLRLNLDDNPAVSKQLLAMVDGTAISDQAYLPPKENPPLLAAAGWACRLTDAKHATDLIDRAVQMEQDHPTAFLGQMDFAYLWLIDRATVLRDHEQIIGLLRQQADRTAWSDDRVPDAVSSLFAAQADFGPLPGFADDLRCYREYFMHPEMIYTLGRLTERQGHLVAAEALNTAALLMSGDSTDAHYLAGIFLESHHWIRPAETEFKWALTLSDGKVPNIYFQLSALADERDDDLASAQYMEAGLQKLADSHGLVQTNHDGDVSPWNPDDGWAEVHWHYLRAARDAGDTAGVKLHLEKLLSMDQDMHVLERDPGMAADIVPALQAQGRNEQAGKIFDAAYRSLKEKMDAAPEDPMPKNNLAWLCACSGMKLDEALKLAGQAVAEDPDDAACLDTEAEAFMRSGHPDRALATEAKALQAKPDDVYMQKQIERFRAAVKSKPSH